jgi:hypothetical protein
MTLCVRDDERFEFDDTRQAFLKRIFIIPSYDLLPSDRQKMGNP